MSGSYNATVTTRSSNRGPAAAASNRAALLEAARHLLAEHGYGVPLSTIAKTAGVGQGVLYRHFPTRIDLALAVFEENFQVLEGLATDEDADTFERLFSALLDMTVHSLGFIELVVGTRELMANYDGGQRLTHLVGESLERAKDAGLIAAWVTPAEVELGLRMGYGAAVTAREAVHRAESVQRVREILALLWRPERH